MESILDKGYWTVRIVQVYFFYLFTWQEHHDDFIDIFHVDFVFLSLISTISQQHNRIHTKANANKNHNIYK